MYQPDSLQPYRLTSLRVNLRVVQPVSLQVNPLVSQQVSQQVFPHYSQQVNLLVNQLLGRLANLLTSLVVNRVVSHQASLRISLLLGHLDNRQAIHLHSLHRFQQASHQLIRLDNRVLDRQVFQRYIQLVSRLVNLVAHRAPYLQDSLPINLQINLPVSLQVFPHPNLRINQLVIHL